MVAWSWEAERGLPEKRYFCILILGLSHGCIDLLLLFSHVWLCNPMDCSPPGFPVLHYLSEFAQTHVHWVSDAMQPSHPLLLPSPPVLNLSQHQGLFQWNCTKVANNPQISADCNNKGSFYACFVPFLRKHGLLPNERLAWWGHAMALLLLLGRGTSHFHPHFIG